MMNLYLGMRNIPTISSSAQSMKTVATSKTNEYSKLENKDLFHILPLVLM